MSYQDAAWPAAPGRPLSPREVRVWRVALGRPAGQVGELETLLSDDERRRADGFRFEKDRGHYVVARGTLRLILGGCLSRPPARLRFSYNAFGKPFLADESAAGGLRFSLSHSRGMALYALTRGREIGVDVEHMQPDVRVAEIAARFFSPREVEALDSLPTGARRRAFYTCWTRKEAYIKARGQGLSLPLDNFTVTIKQGERAALLDVVNEPSESARWRLHDLTPGADYAAAVAVEGRDWQLTTWHWSDAPPAPAAGGGVA